MYKKRLSGFTLLELIIVVVIVGILAAVSIPIYRDIVEKRKGETCINDMRIIFTAWEIHLRNGEAFDHGGGDYRSVETINNAFGIDLCGRYFGKQGPPHDPPLYGFIMDENFSGDPSWFQLETYRQSGSHVNEKIQCIYYPNVDPVTGHYYVWSGTWFVSFPDSIPVN